MDRLKKIEQAQQVIKSHAHLLACPLCGRDMKVSDPPSVTCLGGHCFNIARQGYVNLLQKNVPSRYDLQVFEARGAVAKSGFFDPLLQEMATITKGRLDTAHARPLSILDAGCGEGSALVRFTRFLCRDAMSECTGVGADISKAGIYIAAREHRGYIWCVANLSSLPLKDRQFDLVLNILAPANYDAFQRVLHANGMLLKVIPGPGHLIEIRRAFGHRMNKLDRSSAKVTEHLEASFDPILTRDIKDQVKIKRELLEPLVRMTPLSWNASPDQVEAFLQGGSRTISVDLRIIAAGPPLDP